MSMNVLIAAPVHSVLTDGLSNAGFTCIVREQITQEEGLELVADCVGIITSTRLQIDKELIDRAKELKWVGRMGSGMEVIDLDYADAKGVKCFGSPDGNCNAVAEHALGMLLALNNNIVKSNKEVLEGKWIRNANRGTEIEGKTVGIIGYGHTGQAFAEKLCGFNTTILVYDKYISGFGSENVKECTDLEELFEHSDILSFHVPLSKETTYYMNAQFVEQMKKPFTLINTSRGTVVDITALYNGLQTGKIKSACLDVWVQEPIAAMGADVRAVFEKVAAMPNVLITPHIAGYSHESLYKMSKILLDKIVSIT